VTDEIYWSSSKVARSLWSVKERTAKRRRRKGKEEGEELIKV
jgi:hypothetical protein